MSVTPHGNGVRVATSHGDIDARTAIVAAGPGSRQLMPDLPAPLRVTREVMALVRAARPGAVRRPDRFPVFLLESPHGKHYGFPPIARRLVKIAKHHHRDETVDPGPRRSRRFGRRRSADPRGRRRPHPGGRTARSRSAKTCLYTVTPDRDFLIDRLPGAPNIIVASPCSGHGFKFAPVVGEILADLATEAAPDTTSAASGSAGSADRLLHPFGQSRSNKNGPHGGMPMLGLMQDWPLLCHRIIDHAAIQHARSRRSSSRSVEGPIHTTNYAEVRKRALKLAQRLDRDGIKLGDRVATLGWNTWRHLEAWYGILGIGAIYHTVNPRLFPEQIVWIVNHAEDRVMMIDLTFVPLLEKLADKLPTIERYVDPDRRRAHAADDAEERGALRGMDRRSRRRLRLEELRREHRRRHVLHLRHHRQSQGRALLAPLQRAARLHGVAAGRQGHRGARRGAAGRAAVSRQLLVARLLDAADRRLADAAGAEARRPVDL